MDICVYGASADGLRAEYREAARSLGRLIADGGHRLIFGGGAGGLMGDCAEGALSGGAEIIGIAPRFFDEPGVLFQNCSRLIFTDTISQRKALMEDMAQGFVVLPGGIGTLEEFFETLTLKQLGRHGKAMAMLNTLGYYDSLFALLRETAALGFMGGSCLGLFRLCQSPGEALKHVLSRDTEPAAARALSDYCK